MRERASALFQRAVDYELQKNDFESLKHFEQAMKLFGAGADVVGEAISRRRIANILFRRGEFSEALALNRESLRVFERAKHLREIAYAQANLNRLWRHRESA